MGAPTKVERVWDTTQLPFVDLTPQLGSALSSVWLSDLAIGDFNGDLRSDFFTPQGNVASNVADIGGAGRIPST